MNTGFSAVVDGFWIFCAYVLPIAFGTAALIISAVRPGKNAASVRAVAVVALFASLFWVGIAAIVWALWDAFFPNVGITLRLPEIKVKGKKGEANGPDQKPDLSDK